MSLPAPERSRTAATTTPSSGRSRSGTRTTGCSTGAGIDTVTLGVFAWALTQPGRGHLRLHAAGPDRGAGRRRGPADLPGHRHRARCRRGWRRAHPEVNRTDFEGRRHRYGQRHNSCPSSPVFRRLSAELARRIAAAVRRQPGRGRLARRQRVRRRLLLRPVRRGVPRLAARPVRHAWTRLNAAWYTTFWSHTFTDWDEIEPPSALTEHWRGPDHTAFQGITLDYLRFMSEAMLRELPRREGRRSASPARTRPVTTNFMGMYRPIDYHRWAAAPGLRLLGQLPARTTARRPGWP